MSLNNRNFTIITGPEGKKMFDLAFERCIIRDSLRLMNEHEWITKHEYSRLGDMIESEDIENLYLAREIIRNKLNLTN